MFSPQRFLLLVINDSCGTQSWLPIHCRIVLDVVNKFCSLQLYGLWGCNAPGFICWFRCYINWLFAYLTSLFTSLLIYFFQTALVPFPGRRV